MTVYYYSRKVLNYLIPNLKGEKKIVIYSRNFENLEFALSKLCYVFL